jgi:hypothetical protein
MEITAALLSAIITSLFCGAEQKKSLFVCFFNKKTLSLQKNIDYDRYISRQRPRLIDLRGNISTSFS